MRKSHLTLMNRMAWKITEVTINSTTTAGKHAFGIRAPEPGHQIRENGEYGKVNKVLNTELGFSWPSEIVETHG